MENDNTNKFKVLNDAIDRIRKAHQEIKDAYEDYHQLNTAFYLGVSTKNDK